MAFSAVVSLLTETDMHVFSLASDGAQELPSSPLSRVLFLAFDDNLITRTAAFPPNVAFIWPETGFTEHHSSAA